MSTFASDLKQGQYFEKLFIETYITSKHVENSSSKGIFKEWDIKTTDSVGTEILYEIKSDGKGHFTNNVCIEYAYNDKPSGITATKADFWCHYIPSPNYTQNKYKLIKIDTLTLRQMIADKMYKFKCKGGDMNKASMYLFPLALFANYIIANTLEPS